MKALRKLMVGLMTALAMISLSSCGHVVIYDEDDEIGFDISGLFGKLWEADMNESVYDHGREWPIYSEFEFIRGSFPDHGVGRETQRFMDNDEIYQVMDFEWRVEFGDLGLHYYDYGLGTMWLNDLITYRDYFSAFVDKDRYRTDFYLVGTRAAEGDSTQVVKARKIEGPIQFKVKRE